MNNTTEDEVVCSINSDHKLAEGDIFYRIERSIYRGNDADLHYWDTDSAVLICMADMSASFVDLFPEKVEDRHWDMDHSCTAGVDFTNWSTCQHKPDNPHRLCCKCGKCREDLDGNDVCTKCCEDDDCHMVLHLHLSECQHKTNAPHMLCCRCGQCREDLDEDDVCTDCCEDDD